MADFQNMKLYREPRNVAIKCTNNIYILRYFKGRYRYYKSVNDPSSKFGLNFKITLY